jgi:hypothetical protein
LFGVAGVVRLRCVLTGAQAEAYATERQKLVGVIVFSYDATLRNALRKTVTRADDSCFAAGGFFCCAG